MNELRRVERANSDFRDEVDWSVKKQNEQLNVMRKQQKMQIEMQAKADETQAADQQRHEHDKIELYRALEDQQDRLMQRIGATENQVEVND